MVCKEEGSKSKYAKSVFKSLSFSNDEKLQLIACKLFTGRTHQIRVHLESISRHIIGDHIYALSPKDDKSERILLHAYIIYFIHPTTKESVSFVASLDSNMREFIYKKFNKESVDEIIQIDNILHSFSTTA
jgi:23S rRNA pseudouridine1911/1915/1917 synthase